MATSIPFRKIRTLFFDYDGTLHNSIKIYGPAFRKAYDHLVHLGFAEERNWTDTEISHWLGYNPLEMWNRFMPGLEDTVRNRCSAMIGEEMIALTEHGRAELYEGAAETLEYLKNKGYRLVFLSNCKRSYRDSHSRRFGLEHYFEKLVCSEEYDFIPKYEILKEIKGDYPEEMVMIGDRMHDLEAGKKNRIYTIGCSYGFALEGELMDADLILRDIAELKHYL